MKRAIALFAVFVAALGLMATGGPSPAGAQSGARIHLIHGIPDTPVDVVAGGEVVFSDFQFGDTQDLSALAGQTLTGLQVRRPGPTRSPSTPATSRCPPRATCRSSPTSTPRGTRPSTCSPTTRAPSPPARAAWSCGTPRPPRPSTSGPTATVAFANLSNPNEAQADLPAGTISADVVPTGATEPVVIGPADLPITEGSTLIVYAVGSLDAGTLTDAHRDHRRLGLGAERGRHRQQPGLRRRLDPDRRVGRRRPRRGRRRDRRRAQDARRRCRPPLTQQRAIVTGPAAPPRPVRHASAGTRSPSHAGSPGGPTAPAGRSRRRLADGWWRWPSRRRWPACSSCERRRRDRQRASSRGRPRRPRPSRPLADAVRPLPPAPATPPVAAAGPEPTALTIGALDVDAAPVRPSGSWRAARWRSRPSTRSGGTGSARPPGPPGRRCSPPTWPTTASTGCSATSTTWPPATRCR